MKIANRARFRAKAAKILAILVVFATSLAVASYLWILNHYNSDMSFDVVLFHLRFPLVGANNYFVYSYILTALVPSVIFSVFFALNAANARL